MQKPLAIEFKKTPQSRNLALDGFRGLTIALMVLVNNPGNYVYVYHPLQHSHWHGCTLADFVFPFFLLIAGISIPFSLASRSKTGADRRKLLASTFVRGAKLFALGLMVNNFPFYNIHDWRIPGVLQRIALVYCLSVLISLKCSRKTIAWTVAVLLVLYWGLLSCVPVPGLGAPSLAAPAANIAAWLDQKIFGVYLLHPAAGWDPEGLLGAIPALCLSLIGILAGRMLAGEASFERKVYTLFGAGLLLALAGTMWSVWFPFNRWLWTSSFMLFVAGLGLLLLSVCMVMAERGRLAWLLTPFRILGANAIFIYCFSSVFAKILYSVRLPGANLHDALHDALFASWLSTPNASLGFAAGYTLTMFLCAYWLYAKRITIKV